jgi:hypothetical protein
MILQIFLILILLIILSYKNMEKFSVSGNVVIDGKRAVDQTIPKENLITQEDKKCLEHQAELDLLVGNQVITPLTANKILSDIKCQKVPNVEQGTISGITD